MRIEQIDQLSIQQLAEWMVTEGLLQAPFSAESIEDLNALSDMASRLQAEIAAEYPDQYELFGLSVQYLGEETEDGCTYAVTFNAIEYEPEDFLWYRPEYIIKYKASARSTSEWEARARAAAKAHIMLQEFKRSKGRHSA
jgi:hypothetical protein